MLCGSQCVVGGCNVVVGVLWVVVMWLLGYCGWLPGCYVVVSVLWVVVMWLLGYCGWLPGCCLVVSMLWVVARVVFCGY